jgi:hypothetical protein
MTWDETVFAVLVNVWFLEAPYLHTTHELKSLAPYIRCSSKWLNLNRFECLILVVEQLIDSNSISWLSNSTLMSIQMMTTLW